MDVSGLVFDVGDRVTGWGEIRVDRDGVWFDPPHPIDWIALPPGQRLPRSDHAVRLFGYVPTRNTMTDYSTESEWFVITGVWGVDGITLLQHVPISPTNRHPERQADWTVPPCVAPDQGWPAGTQADLVDLGLDDLRASENCVASVIYRPRQDSSVLVVAATDVAAAEAQWRPVFGGRLCVVQSRWSKAALNEITDILRAGWQHWTLSTIGRRVDDNAQSSVEVHLLRVPPDLARWVAELPDGILELRPTLTPAGR